jgi:5-formyltetrahydrofolate cyclo-ligase
LALQKIALSGKLKTISIMKHALRQQLKEKRRGIATGLYAEKCKKIKELFLHLKEYIEAKKILFYVSKPEEVDTKGLIGAALLDGKKVFVPRIEGDNMFVCPFEGYDQLKKGEFGVMEPTCTQGVDPQEIDLIVVPGVGFDHRGHRLGHGKGHYDRLLKKTRAYKVGLAFEEQLVPELPTEEHDVPVDALLTGSNLLYFKHS